MKRTIQSRSEEFRVRASQCRELAARIHDRDLKRVSQELARQWLELAEQADRRCRRLPSNAST